MRFETMVVRLPNTGLSYEYTKKGVEYRKFRRTKTSNTSFGLLTILGVWLYPYGGIG